MKKLLFIILLSVSGILNAQEVGIRFGGVNGGGGAAIDGVFGVGEGRIHASAGFFGDALGVDVLWDLLYKPLNQENFYWYIGFGPSATIGDPFWLGAAGELGMEYRFSEVPVVIGLDWRPTLWIIEDTRFGGDSFGLNVRWNFGD